MNCPLPEDFVTNNRLWPARSQWSAPCQRTLSHTTDYDPLGLNDQTARQSIDNKTNDTLKVVPMTKLVPKDQLLLVVQGSDCHIVRCKWSNLPEGFEEFWVDALVYWWCNDGEFAFEDAQSKNNDELSEEGGSLIKDTRCGSLCLDLCEPHKCFAPLCLAGKRSWGLNFTTLWEGIQMLCLGWLFSRVHHFLRVVSMMMNALLYVGVSLY
jgi:hypothetical protein